MYFFFFFKRVLHFLRVLSSLSLHVMAPACLPFASLPPVPNPPLCLRRRLRAFSAGTGKQPAVPSEMAAAGLALGTGRSSLATAPPLRHRQSLAPLGGRHEAHPAPGLAAAGRILPVSTAFCPLSLSLWARIDLMELPKTSSLLLLSPSPAPTKCFSRY